MPIFSLKCRKQLRKIFYSKIFSCVCFQAGLPLCKIFHTNTRSSKVTNAKNTPLELICEITRATRSTNLKFKDQSETLSLSKNNVSEKLEILLLKTLKNQLEEREYQNQIKNALLRITRLLDQIEKNYEIHPKLFQRHPNDEFSKFTITVSQDSFIHCQTDARNKSLVVLNEKNVNSVTSGNSVILHKCHNEFFNASRSLIPQGNFSSILYSASTDKAIQYDPKYSISTQFLTNSRFIQTKLLNLSNFNIISFKVNIVKHIRNLKHDLITLRQILNNVEHYSSCTSDAKDVSVFTPNGNFWNEGEIDNKFFEAKIRAANFVRFYKLRKVGDKKKNNKVRRGGKGAIQKNK